MSIRYLLRNRATLLLCCICFFTCCTRQAKVQEHSSRPGYSDELLQFRPYENNPLFSGTGMHTWDKHIRERGFIIKEADGYHLWYTGYRDTVKHEGLALGYATSKDGISWTRYPGNPIFSESWVEDMMVVKHEGRYYMFAEGQNDIAHLLTSDDKVNWTDHGSLAIKATNGQPLSPGPYGTPTVYIEGDVWHLFYERNDLGIWHATSGDLKEWRNVADEPVIAMGPEPYDRHGVALNQIVRHGDHYYGYYHGTPVRDWSEWNTNVAISTDLHRWKKYHGNPILRENKSSAIVVDDGEQYRLYTMHDKVQLHFSLKPHRE